MPRQSTAAVVTTTVANGATRDDLEELPDFTLPPEDVRPSERCGTPSFTGIGCTFRDEHSGRHSWQPAEPEAETLEQDELPGTPDPDPEPSDFDIPTETQFAGKDFVNAPGLQAIAERLIESKAALSVLDGVEVRYLWKRRGGSSGGNPKLGALQRPGGLLRYYAGGVTFILWLAADHCRDLSLTPKQIEAATFHQLLHADTNPDDEDAYRIRGHSFEGFVEEFDEFGAWSSDLREAVAHVQSLPLDQALAAVDSDDGDDDDGEESE
jgi:hypothetical protein